MDNQSFNVDDIRRIRDETSERWRYMTHEEICRDITEGAEPVHRKIAEIRRKKAAAAFAAASGIPETAPISTPPVEHG